MKLMVTLNNEELQNLQFPIIVEMWDKVKGSFSKKRKYKEAFTEEERNTIARYHSLFHKWYLVSGIPNEKSMSVSTLTLLKRAIDFFATV